MSAAIFEAELVVEPTARRRAWPVRWWQGGRAVVEVSFGMLSLLAGLAVLATLPVLQFLSLGYLLEASGRVARSGRLRDGFIGVRTAARLGSVVLGTWLLLLPVRVVSRFWYSAYLIDPHSDVTRGWRLGLIACTVLVVSQVIWAWCRGGRLAHFFWPAPIRFVKRLFRGRKYVEARDAVWDFVASLRIPHYFWLGVRGFAGALAWLLIPTLLLIGATTLPPPAAVLSGLLGAFSFGLVVFHLPFLQTQFAMQQKLGAMFQLGDVYRGFARAPLAFWLALVVTLLFALPLYLLKIELTVREVAMLPSLIFVAFIYPARLLTGWALGRAQRAGRPWRWWTRGLACVFAVGVSAPVVGFYVLVVFFTRYTSWYGVWSLFEQHAFLLPVPFLGL